MFGGLAPQARYEGEGGCFLEVGRGEAMMVEGNFLAEPAPQVALSDQSPDYIDDKVKFEKQRLLDWF